MSEWMNGMESWRRYCVFVMWESRFSSGNTTKLKETIVQESEDKQGKTSFSGVGWFDMFVYLRAERK